MPFAPTSEVLNLGLKFLVILCLPILMIRYILRQIHQIFKLILFLNLPLYTIPLSFLFGGWYWGFLSVVVSSLIYIGTYFIDGKSYFEKIAGVWGLITLCMVYAPYNLYTYLQLPDWGILFGAFFVLFYGLPIYCLYTLLMI